MGGHRRGKVKESDGVGKGVEQDEVGVAGLE